MSKARKQYTKEFKLEALQKWESSDKSAAAIENELGLSKGQLYRWKRALKKQSAESSKAKTTTKSAAPSAPPVSDEAAINEAMGQLKARVEEIKSDTERFSPTSFSPEKLYKWIQDNVRNFELPIIAELTEKLQSTSVDDFRNPETWREIWVIVSQNIQQEMSNMASRAEEIAAPAISKAQEQLDGLPTFGEGREQINQMSAVKQSREFVEGLPGVKEGRELLNSVPGAATLNSLGEAIDKTAPKDLLDAKTWEGFWKVVNHSLSKEIQALRGQPEEEIIEISEE